MPIKTAGPIRYWKVSPGANACLWDACRDGGYIAIGWDEISDISEMSRLEFDERRDALLAKHAGESSWTKARLDQVWDFAHIKVGDRIVANNGTKVVCGIGTVTDGYYFVPDDAYGHRLPVQWDDLTVRQIAQGGWRQTLLPVSVEKFNLILHAPELDRASPPRPDNPVEPDDENNHQEAVQNPPYGLSEMALDTCLNESLLRRWARAIERKGQAILYGPPGTGKTFVAERLARHLIGNGDGFCDLVQFHPSYSYEEFVQGIRPQPLVGGGLHYPLVPGRFLEFCNKARERTGRCVLIVDEINRANLARVFGELMYLLEYRDREIPLAGGGIGFRIPANVRILGTMNTADRSIALVDHALRRRFAFLALYPDYEVLFNYHRTHAGFPVEQLVSVLKGINAKIGDRHYEIGVSFFLRHDLSDQIADIWEMEIEPYLEEFFFDQPEVVASFRWHNIQHRLMP